MSRIFVARTALLASAAVALVSPAAHAQDAETNIVVTGERQAYRGDVALKDLPQNITVLSSEALAVAGVTRLDTALDLASGVSRQNNFGGLWDSFAVRGFSGDENVPSGYLVNGFNGGRGFGGTRDASNVERIEVLKGPGSALFGRGEPGGTVNIVTKKPKFDLQGSATVSAGSWDTYRVEGDITGPLTNNIAVRLNGAYEDADSFRDYVSSKKKTLTPSILVKLGEGTTATYELEWVEQEVPFERGVVASPEGKLGIIPRSRFLGEPEDGPTKAKALGHQFQLTQELGGDWALLLGAGYRETSLKGFSSDPELAVGRQPYFAGGSILARQRRYRDFQAQHLVFRGEVSGTLQTGAITHHILFGADWEDFDIDQVQLRIRPNAATYGIDIFDPVYRESFSDLPVPTTFRDEAERQNAWGVYLQDQIDLTDALKVRIGGRYDEFKQSIDFLANDTPTSR